MMACAKLRAHLIGAIVRTAFTALTAKTHLARLVSAQMMANVPSTKIRLIVTAWRDFLESIVKLHRVPISCVKMEELAKLTVLLINANV